jgi:hypothetical protein
MFYRLEFDNGTGIYTGSSGAMPTNQDEYYEAMQTLRYNVPGPETSEPWRHTDNRFFFTRTGFYMYRKALAAVLRSHPRVRLVSCVLEPSWISNDGLQVTLCETKFRQGG